MTAAAIIGLFALAVFSAAVQSALGFGQGLTIAPGLFAALTAPQAVVASLLLALVLNALVLRGEARRPAVDRRFVGLMLAGGIPGMLAGLVVLDGVAKSDLQVAVGVVILLAVALQVRGARRPASERRYGVPDVATGVAAGVLNTATSLSGPPLALRLAGQPLSAVELRDTLTASLMSLNVFGLALLVATHSLASLDDGLLLALILAPGVPAGHRLGRAAFVRMSAGQHRRALLVAVGLAGLASVVLGLAA